ncbi:hypothetical protein AF6_2567 [Anoxybacillus flavithermus TNO-09.006]|nr:hypothetical protein AF6_2567 [Anoxybacillus flavithermus TNO-09.006]
MLVQLVLKKIRPTFGMFVFVLISSISCVMLLGRIPFVFIEILSSINPRYIDYITHHPGGTGLILLFILRVLIILYLLLFTKYNEYQYEKNLLMISLFFMIIGFYNVFIERIGAYFSTVLVLLLPNVLYQMKLNKERWLHKYCFTVIFLLVFMFSLIFYADLIPYKTYLNV